MTNDSILKANALVAEIEKLEQCIKFFGEPFSNLSVRDERERKSIIASTRNYFITAFSKKEIQLNPQGWFGGERCEVDIEFLEYCVKYFEEKLKIKEQQLSELV